MDLVVPGCLANLAGQGRVIGRHVPQVLFRLAEQLAGHEKYDAFIRLNELQLFEQVLLVLARQVRIGGVEARGAIHAVAGGTGKRQRLARSRVAGAGGSARQHQAKDTHPNTKLHNL